MGQRRPVFGFVRQFLAPISIMIFAFAAIAVAAPHQGEEFLLRQPDGSDVPVIIWGDEFYQDVECLDGFTLVRDADGWICYARLNADGSEYVSTGVRYTGPRSRSPGGQRRIRINKESMLEKHGRSKRATGYNNDEMIPKDRRRGTPPPGVAPAPMETQMMVGLTVLVAFPEGNAYNNNGATGQREGATRSSVTRQSMDDFCNRVGGFNGANAAGSVRDYFLDVSGGLLDYRNIVTPFVTVDSAKSFYDRGTNYQYVRPLVAEALRRVKTLVESGELDISSITTETDNQGRHTVMALNVMYSGSATQGWANGIWPHQGSNAGGGAVTINVPAGNGNPARTIRFNRYQLASLGSNLTSTTPPGIGTFVHENGHMIMRWPDYYNYNNTVTNVVGGYCVMSSSNGSNPQLPNPYLRDRAGWITVMDVTNMNGLLTHESNSHTAIQFRRNNQESYYIESRRRVGRSANIPGEGLIVWHVHTNGRNTELNTANPFPQVKVVRANEAASTLTPFPTGGVGANNPFRAGGGSNNTAFHGTSSPPALYFDGTVSPIRITEVSVAPTNNNMQMTFRIGTGGGVIIAPTYTLTVVNGTGGGEFEAGEEALVGASATNTDGARFLRWTANNAAVTFENPYLRPQTITMPAGPVTATAHYTNVVTLPGTLEADVFGYATSGIISHNNTSATGGTLARFTANDAFAEYIVQAGNAGTYQLSYVVSGGQSASGLLRLVDMTGNNRAIVDSINITTGSTLRTVVGKRVVLGNDRAVWRLERVSGTGNINIDRIVVAEAELTDVFASAPRAAAPLVYGIRASASGNVVFQVPSAGRVNVRMYDIRGREVAVLSSGIKNPGVYSVNAAKRGLGQGMYVIKMEADGYLKNIRFNYSR